MKRFKNPNFKMTSNENQANERGQKPGCHIGVNGIVEEYGQCVDRTF